MSSHGKRILLVADDDDVAAAVSTFLELHGFEVHRAADARAGLNLARQLRPDLVLMDVIMGERTDGFFAVQSLRRTPGLEHVPVFVVSSVYSASPEFQVAPERSWLAHDEFFAKPVDLPALLKAISARVSGNGHGALAPNPGMTK
jgi:CheY-like chemotaxis protein